jgi:hypothetical protein
MFLPLAYNWKGLLQEPKCKNQVFGWRLTEPEKQELEEIQVPQLTQKATKQNQQGLLQESNQKNRVLGLRSTPLERQEPVEK